MWWWLLCCDPKSERSIAVLSIYASISKKKRTLHTHRDHARKFTLVSPMWSISVPLHKGGAHTNKVNLQKMIIATHVILYNPFPHVIVVFSSTDSVYKDCQEDMAEAIVSIAIVFFCEPLVRKSMQGGGISISIHHPGILISWGYKDKMMMWCGEEHA